MTSFWQKLNYLVPEPKCKTKENQITEWIDSRVQPTDVQINAVTDQQANEGLVNVDEKFINDELAKPAGNPFTILKTLRRLGKI